MHADSRQPYLHALGIPQWVPRVQVAEVLVSEQSAAELPPESMVVQAAVPLQPVRPSADIIATMDWPALEAAVKDYVTSLAADLNPVFEDGSRTAQLMIVGEAPGEEEDRYGKPFVGRSGQLLNAMLKAIGYDRSSVYIANVLKHRPPQNRDPQAAEVLDALPFLTRQIALVQPKLILAVGRVAASHLLNTELALGKLRNVTHHYIVNADHSVPVCVTYHPAYLLRRPLEKRKSWADLQWAQQLLSSSSSSH